MAALAGCGNRAEAVHDFAHAGDLSLVLYQLLLRDGACGGLAFRLVAIGGNQTSGLRDTGLVVCENFSGARGIRVDVLGIGFNSLLNVTRHCALLGRGCIGGQRHGGGQVFSWRVLVVVVGVDKFREGHWLEM